MWPRRKPEPRVCVLCRCGAQWWGRYALDNPVIPIHAARCGDPITEAAFRLLGFTPTPPLWWREERKGPARD